MEGMNLEKHHALVSSQGVRDLCRPLLDRIGITYFNYIKIHHQDGARELLTSNPEWVRHFYQQGLYNSKAAMAVEHVLPEGHFLWSQLDKTDPAYTQGRDFFNLDHGISFVMKRPDVTYIYVFATTTTNQAIHQFYAGNIDLLQRFIQYFTDHAQPLIKEASQHRIRLPGPQPVDHLALHDALVVDDVRQAFLADATINRYFLLNAADDVFLTRKQAECARLLAYGYTSKQMAKHMDISYRTVEGYVGDIKSKLQDTTGHLFTRTEMMHLLRQSNIH